jgi:hypothetical protein
MARRNFGWPDGGRTDARPARKRLRDYNQVEATRAGSGCLETFAVWIVIGGLALVALAVAGAVSAFRALR